MPPPIAKVEPPDLLSFTKLRTVSAISVTEDGPPKAVGVIELASISVTELVISLPAPKIKEPLELLVLLAVPTTVLLNPEYLLAAVADSIEFKEPLIVAP